MCALVDLLWAVALATPGPVLDRIVHSVRMFARAQRPPHCHVKPFPVGATRCKKGLFVAWLASSWGRPGLFLLAFETCRHSRHTCNRPRERSSRSMLSSCKNSPLSRVPSQIARSSALPVCAFHTGGCKSSEKVAQVFDRYVNQNFVLLLNQHFHTWSTHTFFCHSTKLRKHQSSTERSVFMVVLKCRWLWSWWWWW